MNVKIVFPPAFNSQLYCLPLEMATLTPLLKEHGYGADQDNLPVKWYLHRYLKKNSDINLEIFNQVPVVENYLNGHDEQLIEKAVNELLKIFDYKRYDLFKFILRNYKQIAATLCIGKKLKELTGKIIVLGGPFPQTIVHELQNKYPFIDHVITGEGEMAFLDLLEKIKNKQNPGSVVGSQQKIDLNALPTPEFDLLTVKIYKSIKAFYLPYETIRGCPSRCSFCPSGVSEKLRFKTPQKICRDIEVLRDKYDARLFHFSSSSINFSKKFLLELLQEMTDRKLDVRWSSYAIPNAILTDSNIVRKMKEMGCIKLKFGVESGSDEMLDLFNKACSVETTAKVLETVHREGIYTYASFVHSYLYEPRKAYLKTLQYLKVNGRNISMARPCRFVLHWGSPVYHQPQSFGIKIRPRQNSIFCDSEVNPFDEVNGLSWEEKQKEQNRRHKEILRFANNMDIFTERRITCNRNIPLSHKLSLELQGLS